MPGRYVPERMDLVRVQFNPRVGREQAGHRPALVMSPASYNQRAGLALVCPVTSQKKGYPFEVDLPEGLSVRGAILCDQIKSIDWNGCVVKKIDSVPVETMNEVVAQILLLVDLA